MAKKNTTGHAGFIPMMLPAPDASEARAVLEALRCNLSLLGELAVRYGVATQPERPQNTLSIITNAADVFALLGAEMAALAQEQLRVLLLNARNAVVGQQVIYQGNISSVSVRTAEVLRPAVVEAVPGVIVVHNHPSGDPSPSPQDLTVTRTLSEAAKILDVELLDHVVIGTNGFVSLKDLNLLP